GRQPWTVFGLMTTADSISPSVSAGQVLFSIIAFCTIYAALGVIMVYLYVKVIKKGPYMMEEVDAKVTNDPFAKEGFHA
ncbi:cytochrome ubiquinol oxidase subunit I, partial [Niallia sp.]|uniref:cytochrome ubiquinol oxidase subunit I n=1 Tax=Niallia sp. TaxID=2837523 RepID=UPI0028A2C0A8